MTVRFPSRPTTGLTLGAGMLIVLGGGSIILGIVGLGDAMPGPLLAAPLAIAGFTLLCAAHRWYRTGIYVRDDGGVDIVTVLRTLRIDVALGPRIEMKSIFSSSGIYPVVRWTSHSKDILQLSRGRLLMSKRRYSDDFKAVCRALASAPSVRYEPPGRR